MTWPYTTGEEVQGDSHGLKRNRNEFIDSYWVILLMVATETPALRGDICSYRSNTDALFRTIGVWVLYNNNKSSSTRPADPFNGKAGPEARIDSEYYLFIRWWAEYLEYEDSLPGVWSPDEYDSTPIIPWPFDHSLLHISHALSVDMSIVIASGKYSDILV